MTALVGKRIDLPHIALIPNSWYCAIFIIAAAARLIESLHLILSGDFFGVFTANASALVARDGGRSHRLCNRQGVIVIAARFCQQENVFIAAARTIFAALRHGICLLPDDVRAQIPAVISQRKRQHPRDTEHILCLDIFHSLRKRYTLSVSAAWILRVQMVTFAAGATVGVCNVEP